MAHIDGIAPPTLTTTDYEQWCEIDVIVMQWIYASLSEDLLSRVLDNDTISLTVWEKLKTSFLTTRALGLLPRYMNSRTSLSVQ